MEIESADLNYTIRALQGADFEPDDEAYPHPGLIIIALSLIGWAAFIGAGYCMYRAVEAVWG